MVVFTCFISLIGRRFVLLSIMGSDGGVCTRPLELSYSNGFCCQTKIIISRRIVKVTTVLVETRS